MVDVDEWLSIRRSLLTAQCDGLAATLCSSCEFLYNDDNTVHIVSSISFDICMDKNLGKIFWALATGRSIGAKGLSGECGRESPFPSGCYGVRSVTCGNLSQKILDFFLSGNDILVYSAVNLKYSKPVCLAIIG